MLMTMLVVVMMMHVTNQSDDAGVLAVDRNIGGKGQPLGDFVPYTSSSAQLSWSELAVVALVCCSSHI